MKKLLFVNACARKEKSRTLILCNELLKRFNKFQVETINLFESQIEILCPDEIEKRELLVKENKLNDDLFCFAKQFQQADIIIVGAPYWDLSFPAILKAYIEMIMVCGLTFSYTPNGALGLCRAKKLYYITTSGGYIGNADFGFEYIQGIAKMLGIKECEKISAEGLDIESNCAEDIINIKTKEISLID